MIDGAALYDVLGVPYREGDILFVPVLLDFDSTTATAEIDFFDGAALRSDPFLRQFKLHGGDLYPMSFASLWLRSRMTRIFHFQPFTAGDDTKKSILNCAFVAVLNSHQEDFRIIPFICDECGDGPQLIFHKPVIDSYECNRILISFRQLLLRDIAAPIPFHDYCSIDYDCGDFALAKVGYDSSGAFYEEVIGDFEPAGDAHSFFDGHLGIPGYESWPCPGCEGAGEESFCPVGSICGLCEGAGWFTWVEPWSRTKPRGTSRR